MTEEQIKLLQDIEEGEIVINEPNVDLLNELLVSKEHYLHQMIAKTLQHIKSPTTIPFVKTALDSNFDYLEYTCSDHEAIAKWFSWILFSINTKEAISLIEEYSKSPNEAIRNEMMYRLRKVNSSNI
ncbi:HEAT repeat domain-containing protein [Chitinophaga sp. 22321]|uniref:HEAT repeat domain-containing protein n=1 Tax=Chitinophaga hostae TaxID=2831022 RepID=A0ABS5J685_9BACT|nr:hypothetical protein [Chitinophaga hostae]MBS0030576.1 hypothetical protein [Chitinophaga hostae]